MIERSPAPGRANGRLHAKLSGFYFVYYFAVGAFLPFWPVYLHSLGYTPVQIGTALAATGLVRVAVPVGWGWIMDRSGRRMVWIAGAMAVSALLFGNIPFSHGFTALIALHVAYAIFWNAALPAFDVVTLNHLLRTGAEYARIRLWGSVGFVVSVAGLGPLIDRTGLWLVPLTVVAAMLGMVALGLRIPDVHDQRPHDPALGGFARRLRRPGVWALLLAGFLSQLSFAPYYGFFSLFLEQHHYDHTVIGGLWALGVVAEVIVFLYTGRIIRRFGARPTLVAALVGTSARWGLLALFVDVPVLLVTSQVLHFLSFAVYHAVTVHFIHQLFPGSLQGRAQALLAAVSFGLGGSVGSYSSGYAWEAFGPQAVYLGAAAAAMLGAWVALRAPRLDPA